MKFRQQHRLAVTEAQLAQLEDKLMQITTERDTTVRHLEQRIKQLEAEQHGHCQHCNRPTDYPTISHCEHHR